MLFNLRRILFLQTLLCTFILGIMLACGGDSGTPSGSTPPPAGGQVVFPGSSWQTASASQVGLSDSGLQAGIREMMANGSHCVAVVKDGYLIASEGSTRRKNPMSVGKSVLSSAIGMLYTNGKIRSLDEAGIGSGVTIKENLQQNASGRWNYSPTGAQSDAAAIVRKFGGNVKNLVFDPLGMRNSTINNSSGFMDSTCEDLARWGHLIAQGGNWNGRQLINDQYMRESVQPVPGNSAYGYLYWLNQPGRWSSTLGMSGNGNAIPGAPNNAIYGKGFGGQIVLILPDSGLVVVRLGDDNLLADTMGAARMVYNSVSKAF